MITNLEMETARLVRLGYKNKEIAEMQGVTCGTVKMRLSRMYQKTEVKNRAGLAVWYIRQQKANE